MNIELCTDVRAEISLEEFEEAKRIIDAYLLQEVVKAELAKNKLQDACGHNNQTGMVCVKEDSENYYLENRCRDCGKLMDEGIE